MPTREEIEATLTGPGGPFEVVEEPVLGAVMPVFKERDRSLQTVLTRSASLGDTWMVRCRWWTPWSQGLHSVRSPVSQVRKK